MRQVKRAVIKIGTSSLTYDNGRQNLRRMEQIVRVVSDLKNAGMELVLVSSGAIGVGVSKLGLSERPKTIMGKQATAAVGQCELMYLYDKLFSEYGHVVAQVLLTKDIVDTASRKQNAVNTFLTLLQYGALPIVNENDTVATDELDCGGNFGDNDTLSALVATLIGADQLVIMSDIDGLYDKDPHRFEDAKPIRVVEQIDDQIRGLAGAAGTNRGTGGMVTKIHAAEIATEAGIDTRIVSSEDPKVLYDVFEGKNVGTLFVGWR